MPGYERKVKTLEGGSAPVPPEDQRQHHAGRQLPEENGDAILNDQHRDRQNCHANQEMTVKTILFVLMLSALSLGAQPLPPTPGTAGATNRSEALRRVLGRAA